MFDHVAVLQVRNDKTNNIFFTRQSYINGSNFSASQSKPCREIIEVMGPWEQTSVRVMFGHQRPLSRSYVRRVGQASPLGGRTNWAAMYAAYEKRKQQPQCVHVRQVSNTQSSQ